MIEALDLQFHRPNVIITYLIPAQDGVILVDPGPHSAHPQLVQALRSKGYELSDVKHVLLTHIHFDHAGGTWALCEAGAQAYVHPAGYKHLLAPEKLYNSARQIYGEQMDELWGDMRPIAEDRLTAIEDEDQLTLLGHKLKAWHTPGHAKHHIAWQLGKEVFSGDVAGVRIQLDFAQPPCPPPDIDLEAWEQSIDRVLALQPERLYLTHAQPVDDPGAHMAQLRERLWKWANFVKAEMDNGLSANEIEPRLKAMAHAELREAGADEGQIACYEWANPAFMSVGGLMRYWKKRAEREAG